MSATKKLWLLWGKYLIYVLGYISIIFGLSFYPVGLRILNIALHIFFGTLCTINFFKLMVVCFSFNHTQEMSAKFRKENKNENNN